MELREQMLLYVCTDRSWLKPGETLEEVMETLLENGVTMVQLREKELSHEEMVEEGKRLLPLCRKYNVPLIINDDVAAAVEIGADGVHVGQSDMEIAAARAMLGPDKLIGTSAHNVKEAVAGMKAGADYLGSGAIFGSATKSEATHLSLEELKAICEHVDLPIVAIGGISKENLPLLAGTGIDGVAVISALLKPEDKAAATRELLELTRATLKR